MAEDWDGYIKGKIPDLGSEDWDTLSVIPPSKKDTVILDAGLTAQVTINVTRYEKR